MRRRFSKAVRETGRLITNGKTPTLMGVPSCFTFIQQPIEVTRLSKQTTGLTDRGRGEHGPADMALTWPWTWGMGQDVAGEGGTSGRNMGWEPVIKLIKRGGPGILKEAREERTEGVPKV